MWIVRADVAPYTEGVSSTELRKRWWVSRKLKVLPDAAAVALLRAHEDRVYAPLKRVLIQSVANKMPNRTLSPNGVTALALLTLIPFVAAVKARWCLVAVALAVLHDALDRLDGAVAAACVARGVKHDGDFGAFLDAMCDKVFGATQLALVARRVIAPEAAAMIASVDHFSLALGEGSAGRFTVWQHVLGSTQCAAWMALVGVKLALHLTLAAVRVQDYFYLHAARGAGAEPPSPPPSPSQQARLGVSTAAAAPTAAKSKTRNSSSGKVSSSFSSSSSSSSSASARRRSSIPAVGEGKLATFAENLGVAVLLASTTLGPVLAVPTAAQLFQLVDLPGEGLAGRAAPGAELPPFAVVLRVATFGACTACHALAFASLVVSVDMAARSLRHKLVCRA